MFKKKNKKIEFIENYVRLHVKSLNWNEVTDGIETKFINYYTRDNTRKRLQVRILINKGMFIHKINIYIECGEAYTFTSWGLSYLSMNIMIKKLEALIKKKERESKQRNDLLNLFMESEGHEDAESKVQEVSEESSD